jgi:hypothetical protein
LEAFETWEKIKTMTHILLTLLFNDIKIGSGSALGSRNPSSKREINENRTKYINDEIHRDETYIHSAFFVLKSKQ